MSLSSDDVRHLARLARIAVSDADVARLQSQLSAILDHFAALAAVDTEGVEPTAYPLPLSNVMREDRTEAPLPVADVLANAPEREDDFLRVRAVIE